MEESLTPCMKGTLPILVCSIVPNTQYEGNCTYPGLHGGVPDTQYEGNCTYPGLHGEFPDTLYEWSFTFPGLYGVFPGPQYEEILTYPACMVYSLAPSMKGTWLILTCKK